MVYCLLGIGNEARADDGAGMKVARELDSEDWRVFECSTAPENFLHLVKRLGPEKVFIVDAADLGLSPGEYRSVPLEDLPEAHLSTHSTPVKLLADHLSEFPAFFIGIQPGDTRFGEEMSLEVEEAVEEIVELLEKKDFNDLF